MIIEPRNDFVLIERIETLPQGNILIPEIARKKSILGKVIAVGPGKFIEEGDGKWVRQRLAVKPGDIVYFNSIWSEFSGSHYVDDQLRDRNMHLVMENDIFLKVTNGYNPD